MSVSERKKILREAVLRAAEGIVAAHGLGAVRARDVARRADCSLGAIYTVFADLDDLVLAVNERTLSRLEERLAGHPAPPVRSPEAVIGWLVGLSEIYLEFAAANRRLWLALFEHRMADGSGLPPDQTERRQALFAFIEQPLEWLAVEPGPEARRLLARSLFSAVHGLVALGLEEKLAQMSLATLREQIAIVVGAVVRGLLEKRKR